MLIDATYEPVNTYPLRERNAVILRDHELLREDLRPRLPGPRRPGHPNQDELCALLEPRLTADGFRVLNAGAAVYFPSHGRQPQFHQQFGAMLRSA